VRIEFESLSEKLDWSKTALDALQLYLGGTQSCGHRLFESMMRDTLGLGWYSQRAPSGIFVGPEHLVPTGYEPDQGLLEHDPRTPSSYRILWDFFALPEKFRFLKAGTAGLWDRIAGNQLALVVFLGRHSPDLQKNLSADAIQLGCVPAVNLFEKGAEPIPMSEAQSEYRVVPSYRSVDGLEVHSIQSVVASRFAGEDERTFQPFYEPSHRVDPSKRDRYWYASRRNRLSAGESGDRGTEVYLTIVDLHSRPAADDEWVLHVDTVCCNRDLVNDLSMQTPLHFHGGPVIARFHTSPTPTLRPVQRDDWVWRLISHLTLNHLTISGDSNGKLLREMLHLYNSQDREDIRVALDGILAVQYQRGTARLRDAQSGSGICRGTEIELTIDEERFDALGSYLFASVLDRFFAQLTTINAFTRLRLRSKGGTQILYQGPPRCGAKSLM
jgi:type VI secretion system protein ImpG